MNAKCLPVVLAALIGLRLWQDVSLVRQRERWLGHAERYVAARSADEGRNALLACAVRQVGLR